MPRGRKKKEKTPEELQEEIKKQREEDLLNVQLWYMHTTEKKKILDISKETGIDRKEVGYRIVCAQEKIDLTSELKLVIKPSPGKKAPNQTPALGSGESSSPEKKIPGSITRGIVLDGLPETVERTGPLVPLGAMEGVKVPDSNPLLQFQDITQLAQVGYQGGLAIGAVIDNLSVAFGDKEIPLNERLVMAAQSGSVILPLGVTVMDLITGGAWRTRKSPVGKAPRIIKESVILDDRNNE